MNDMQQYALYLRKSRADMDAESRGEGETLAKHRAALISYAQSRGLFIAREYAEIVSGDSIAARPQMQALLNDVKAGQYAGVIVNDVDRLGRGDSIDQEIIKLTFAASHTLIITPTRDIDPANPSDDDMLDFSMFMARFEYKKIAQRMKQGRIRSAASGNWVVGTPPFGYRVVRENGRIQLQPDERAPIVRMIYDWYANGDAGYYVISKRLAQMRILTQKGNVFNAKGVRDILMNVAYIGTASYGGSAVVSIIEKGQRVKRRVRSTPTEVENAHPAIIDRETWQRVQDRARLAKHRSPVTTNAAMKSPLAGLIVCAECGHYMQRIQSSRRPLLVCMTHGCPTSATYVDLVEDALLEILRSWCVEYAEPSAPSADNTEKRDALKRQAETLAQQLTRAQELVELGVYTPSEYLTRRDALQASLSAVHAELDKLSRSTPEQQKHAILPVLRRVIDAYPLAQSVEQKNTLLASVVDRVIYHKTRSARKNENPAQYLTLDVYPVIGISP